MKPQLNPTTNNKQTHQPLYQLISGRGLPLLQHTCLAHHARWIPLCVAVILPTDREETPGTASEAVLLNNALVYFLVTLCTYDIAKLLLSPENKA